MLYKLSSESLEVFIHEHGAEIHSVKNRQGSEFIWQAGERWPRHAPVLFPIVGKLKNDTCFFEGKSYCLPQHGFARDKKFRPLESENSSCSFILETDEKSLEKYPFLFSLVIKYSLHENVLITTYTVQNRGKGNMFFSIGSHPGFRCPINEDEKFEDYYLLFEKDELSRSILKDGLLSDEREIIKLKGGKLCLSTELFESDALIFEGAQINKVELCSGTSSSKITMECGGWPYFGVWSKKNCREFICLEPWYGIADSLDSDQQLINKKGIQVLTPAETFSCSFSLAFA